MGSVPPLLQQRWRSRNLGGQAKHQLIVRVRRGYINRLYQPMHLLDGTRPWLPIIWKGLNMNPWQGQWTLEGDWVTLTEIESAKWTRSTQSDNGSSTLTVVMDNVAFQDTAGVAGLYHTIERGYFSPQKGIKVNSRPSMWATNEWADVLNGGYQIELWEGYGPDGDASVTPLAVPGLDGTCVPPDAAISRTAVGLIDGLDIDSHPDTMTVTVRDFGALLTDQRLIYNNKAPEIRSPVIFADRRTVLGEKPAGYGARASGTRTGYQPTAVLPSSDSGGGWVSDPQGSSTDLPYIEIKLPGGAYDTFYLAAEAAGQSCYVAVNAVGGCRWNGGVIADGWIDDGEPGNLVPGTAVPFVNYIKTVATGGKRFGFGGELQCSEGTVLRIYLTNLGKFIYDANGDITVTNEWVASVFRLWAYRYGKTANAPVPVATGLGSDVKAQGWVLIDDVADIIRMVLTWAGFHEWDVDDFGWSLAQPFNFGQDQFFMDVITSVMNQGNFMFYMESPSDDDMSIGVPCFKTQQAVTLQPKVVTSVRDTDLLEALKVTWDLSNLPYSIRIRGAINKNGVTFGQDLSKRYMGTYFPPWSGIDYIKISPTRKGRHMDHSERLAGLRRNYVQTQGQVISLSLNSDAECNMAAVLTAIQYALAEVTGQLQISGLPGLELNKAIVVVDEASGTNSRVWIDSIESDHNMGENGSWHMTIAGSLLDTEDLSLISEDWAYTVFKYTMARGTN